MTDTTGAAGTADTTGQGAQAMQSTLTDANIAAILGTANDADVANGKLARTASKNADVRRFAQRMITDHGSANDQAKALEKRLGLTPQEDATGQQMKQQADAARDSLRTKKGAGFDRAYIDGEVAMHQQVLDMIDRQLLPGAQNADLKQFIQSIRPTIASHLQEAQRIQGTMAK
jgi:putative membrane protein